MSKIPVGRTIAFAYQFTFGHIGTIIGLIWLPLLIFCVGDFFVMNYYVQGMEAYATGADPMGFGTPFLALMGFMLASLFFVAVIGVAITQQAMGLRTGGAVVHFGLGAAEFNLFLSFLSILLVVGAVYIAIFLGAILFGIVVGLVAKTAVASLGQSAAVAGGVAVGVLVAALALCAVLYVVARLTFLVAPVTVAGGKIDLIRAWMLTKGNFWRIFLIGAGVLLPITLVLFGAEVAILGPAYFIPKFPPPTDTAGQMQQMAAQMRAMSDNLPLLLGLGFLLAPFSYGLIFSAPAFAYRSLVSKPPQVPDANPLHPA